MKELGAIYVCHPDSRSSPKISFETHFARYFHKAATIIWLKQSAGMGWQDYRAQHEPILYGWKKGAGSHFIDDRSKTTVWEIARDAQGHHSALGGLHRRDRKTRVRRLQLYQCSANCIPAKGTDNSGR
jgi:DNA modification methylase